MIAAARSRYAGHRFPAEIIPGAGDKWYLDEVVLKIAGVKPWLWRAVDQTDIVLDVPVQSRRDKRAAMRLPRKLLKRQGRAPRVVIKVEPDHRRMHGMISRLMLLASYQVETETPAAGGVHAIKAVLL